MTWTFQHFEFYCTSVCQILVKTCQKSLFLFVHFKLNPIDHIYIVPWQLWHLGKNNTGRKFRFCSPGRATIIHQILTANCHYRLIYFFSLSMLALIVTTAIHTNNWHWRQVGFFLSWMAMIDQTGKILSLLKKNKYFTRRNLAFTSLSRLSTCCPKKWSKSLKLKLRRTEVCVDVATRKFK